MKFDALNGGAQQIFNAGNTIINAAPGATVNVFQETPPLLKNTLAANLLNKWGVGGQSQNDPTTFSLLSALKRFDQRLLQAQARLGQRPSSDSGKASGGQRAEQSQKAAPPPSLKDLGGGVIDTGRYRIEAKEHEATIFDKETNTSVTAWGDPHVITSDGDKAQFHNQALTIDLKDGTKVTFKPTGVDANGISVLDKVQVLRGKDGVELSGLSDGQAGVISSGVQKGKAKELDRKQADGTVLKAGEQVDDLYFTDKNGKVTGELSGGDANARFGEHMLDGRGGKSKLIADAPKEKERVLQPEDKGTGFGPVTSNRAAVDKSGRLLAGEPTLRDYGDNTIDTGRYQIRARENQLNVLDKNTGSSTNVLNQGRRNINLADGTKIAITPEHIGRDGKQVIDKVKITRGSDTAEFSGLTDGKYGVKGTGVQQGQAQKSGAQKVGAQGASADASQGLEENGRQIDTGRYQIDYSRDTVTITDKETKTSVKAWGDPHFDTSDGDRADFHKKPLTLELQDGTKVTIAPTAVDGNGVSYVDKVQVIKGKEAIEVSGIHNSDGTSSGVVRGNKASQLDRKQDDGTVLRAGEQIDDLYFTGKDGKIRGEFKGGGVNFDNEETGKSKLGDTGSTSDFDRQIQQNLLHDLMARRDSLRKALEARSESTNYDDEDEDDPFTNDRSALPSSNGGTIRNTIGDGGVAKSGAAGQSGAQSSIGDQANEALKKGGSIKFEMTADFDSARWDGWPADPLGGILVKKGEEYTVSHDAQTGAWKSAGYYEAEGSYIGADKYPKYEDLGPGVMNLWGVGLKIGEDGAVSHPQFGKIGQIKEVNGQDVGVPAQPKVYDQDAPVIQTGKWD